MFDFDALVGEYSEKVYNLAFRMLSVREDAEDVVQETFLQVHKGLPQFRGESAISTWIYRIAMNNCLRAKQRMTKAYVESINDKLDRLQDDIPPEVADWAEDPAKATMMKELLATIRQGCLQLLSHRLPEAQRSAFILVYVLDFSYEEAAAVLDVSIGVIKARLNRARSALRAYFGKRCAWLDPGNSCTCESRIGFALAYDPEMLKRVRMQLGEDGDVLSELGDAVPEEIRDVVAIYRRFPRVPYDSGRAFTRLKSQGLPGA